METQSLPPKVFKIGSGKKIHIGYVHSETFVVTECSYYTKVSKLKVVDAEVDCPTCIKFLNKKTEGYK